MKVNALLLGAIGAGKSYSVRTLLPKYPDREGRLREGAGLSVRMLALEAGWEATNGDIPCELGFHAKQCLPASIPWESAKEWAEKIGTMSMKAVADMEVSTIVRQNYQQFVGVYGACSHYVCDRCGQDFGMIDEWGEDTAFVMDGLSGLSTMAIHLVNGPKPIMSLPQYGSAQALIENLMKKLVSISASFVLIAHWAREPNEITGGTNITIDTVGQKLAPKLLRLFDEIILTQHEGNKYSWCTEDSRIDLKARRLPYSSSLNPDFSQIFR